MWYSMAGRLVWLNRQSQPQNLRHLAAGARNLTKAPPDMTDFERELVGVINRGYKQAKWGSRDRFLAKTLAIVMAQLSLIAAQKAATNASVSER